MAASVNDVVPPGPPGTCQWVLVEGGAAAKVREMARCDRPVVDGTQYCELHQQARAAWAEYQREQNKPPGSG